jgi:tetratricopeptide (TPR) repeat protein
MSLRIEDVIGNLNTLATKSSEDSLFLFTILEVIVPQLETHKGMEDKVLNIKHATLVNLDNPCLLLHRVLDILYDAVCDAEPRKATGPITTSYHALRSLAGLHGACPQVRLVILRNSLRGVLGNCSFVSILEEIAVECRNASLFECEASAYELLAESGHLSGPRLLESLDMASRAYYKVYNQRCIYLSKRVAGMAASSTDKELFNYYLDHFAFTLKRFGRPAEAAAIRRQVTEAWGTSTDPAIRFRRARVAFFLGDTEGALKDLRELREVPGMDLLKGKILFLLSRCLMRQGDLAEANAVARECFKLRAGVKDMPRRVLGDTMALVRKTLKKENDN